MDQTTAIGLAVFAGFIFCIVVHECAHALVAYWLGDDTARLLGRITLNPIPHIDPIMSIVLPGMLWLSGAPMFGGAKPVPVNMMNFRHPVRGMMWVALAGPVSNILLALGFGLLLNFFPPLLEWRELFARNYLEFMIKVIGINVLLACFNMIPIPPLDGSRILAAFMPGRVAAILYDYQTQVLGMMLVAVLVFSGGTDFLWPLVLKVTNWILSLTVFTM
jgi:Zn-dependent protease